MKHPVRTSLITISLTTLLGITGCAANTGPATNPADNSGPSATQLPPLPRGEKDKNFTSPARVAGNYPASWNGTGGWYSNTGQTKNSVVAAGDFIGYLDGVVFDGSSSTTVKKPGTLVVVDGDGNRVYTAKQPEGFELHSTTLNRVHKDGKTYLVYVATGLTKENLASAKTQTSAAGTSVVTVIGQDGREVFTKTLNDQERAFVGGAEYIIGTAPRVTADDSIRITSSTAGQSTLRDASQVIDVATGEIAPVPTMKGYSWHGRFDGVDIFGNGAELTNGSWTTKIAVKGVEGFGKFIQIFSGDVTSTAIINPHTGKVSENLVRSAVKESTPSSGIGSSIQAERVSPNGRFVAGSTAAFNAVVVFDTEADKIAYNSTDTKFGITALTDGGDAYGKGGIKNNFASMNVLKGGDPAVETGTDQVPSLVSTSGLAAFSDDATGTFFLVKK